MLKFNQKKADEIGVREYLRELYQEKEKFIKWAEKISKRRICIQCSKGTEKNPNCLRCSKFALEVYKKTDVVEMKRSIERSKFLSSLSISKRKEFKEEEKELDQISKKIVNNQLKKNDGKIPIKYVRQTMKNWENLIKNFEDASRDK